MALIQAIQGVLSDCRGYGTASPPHTQKLISLSLSPLFLSYSNLVSSFTNALSPQSHKRGQVSSGVIQCMNVYCLVIHEGFVPFQISPFYLPSVALDVHLFIISYHLPRCTASFVPLLHLFPSNSLLTPSTFYLPLSSHSFHLLPPTLFSLLPPSTSHSLLTPSTFYLPLSSHSSLLPPPAYVLSLIPLSPNSYSLFALLLPHLLIFFLSTLYSLLSPPFRPSHFPLVINNSPTYQ